MWFFGGLVAQSYPTLCNPMDCIACQAPLSMGFSRQEYWSGLPFLLQGICLTLGSNPGLLHCRRILYCLSHQGSLVGMYPCFCWTFAQEWNGWLTCMSASSCHTVFQSGCTYICIPSSSVWWFSLLRSLTNALMMVGEEASHHPLNLPPQLGSREANPVPHLGVSSFSSPFSIFWLPPADVNECGFKPRPCQHRCVNTHGSYKCFCPSGHMLLPDATCSSKFQQLACSQSTQRLDFCHLMLGAKLTWVIGGENPPPQRLSHHPRLKHLCTLIFFHLFIS